MWLKPRGIGGKGAGEAAVRVWADLVGTGMFRWDVKKMDEAKGETMTGAAPLKLLGTDVVSFERCCPWAPMLAGEDKVVAASKE